MAPNAKTKLESHYSDVEIYFKSRFFYKSILLTLNYFICINVQMVSLKITYLRNKTDRHKC